MCDECTVSFKRLEHPQILTSAGGPRPNMPWRQRVNSILPSGNNCSELSAVRCGTHWYLNCLCPDAAICWDACNVSRQFLWVLTFLKHMATCAKEDEASVGTGCLEGPGGGGCPHSVTSSLPGIWASHNGVYPFGSLWSKRSPAV